MLTINKLRGRQILDSRGNPTIEVDVFAEDIFQTASVPSGASRGKHEAHELRDGGRAWHGLGVQKALKNLKDLAYVIEGVDVSRQREIDELMIKKDNTKDKSRLGANAILAVSLAAAKTAAMGNNLFLFEYLNQLLFRDRAMKMPTPYFNVINGGKHAGNNLAIQECMIVPRMKSFKENLRVGTEVYQSLRTIVGKKYGKSAINHGDEGGFAPHLSTTEQALKVILAAIANAGHSRNVGIALDCAASEFYKKGKYHLDGRKMTKEALQSYYLKLIKKYKIISIEDPFHQDDFTSFAELRKRSKIQIVGDDLTVTNVARIEKALAERSCTCVLIKVNQIGTLTEALDAVRLAYDSNWDVMVSHRSGETEDTFIADLAVGIGCSMIKAGAPAALRTTKYNRLLRIEEILKNKENY